jgi:hypothetical protein
VKLRYVEKDTDRHGNMRYYYRRFGRRIRLRGLPGSAEFTRDLGEASAIFEGKAASRPRPPTYFVYFITLGNARVKIGFTKNVQARFSQLSTTIPGKGRIHYVTPGGRLLEQELHQLFAEDRVNGEWFNYSQAIRDWINADNDRRQKQRGIQQTRTRTEPVALEIVSGMHDDRTD